ncbi:MAG: response regulator [Candidatus Eisenbacteria bacterium]|nr:response regulator [Candidatus Eisenbacteria bacterium]
MGRTRQRHYEKHEVAPIPLLLVDDDPLDREEIHAMLGEQYAIDDAESGEAGWSKLASGRYAAVLLDLDLGPGMSGFDVLERMRREDLRIPVVIVSKTGSVSSVVRAIKMGASNFIGKQAGGREMEIALQKALDEIRLVRDNLTYRREIDALKGRFLATSEASRSLLRDMERLAPTHAMLLISGETGVGKEVVAREIHRLSTRNDRPFFVLDCTTIRDSLAESTLFGHEKGSFSGADRLQLGRFEQADGGTLFLDEIGELPLELQAKFLRVLETGRFQRIGGQHEISVDVRILAATNRDLEQEVAMGRFRQDLYYRLAVAVLTVPPLRERRQDIPPLAEAFLRDLNGNRPGDPVRFSDEAMMALTSHRWPGNVRELKNTVERCFLFADGPSIDKYTVTRILPIDPEDLPNYKESKQRTLDAFEREYIQAVLKITGGNLSQAAQLMDMSRYGLQKAVDRLGIELP